MITSLSTALMLVSRVPRPKQNAMALTSNGSGALRVGARRAQDDLFSVNSNDITRQKLRLMERAGHAVGLRMSDFSDMRSFGQAMREKMGGIDTVTMKVIEASLGLPGPGIGMIDVVDAMENPDGAADDKIETALRRKKANEDNRNPAERPLRLDFDEMGLYGPHVVRQRDQQ